MIIQHGVSTLLHPTVSYDNITGGTQHATVSTGRSDINEICPCDWNSNCSMDEKNRKLARENNDLKSLISKKIRLQEELMKKSIKEEYKQIVTYKQMLESMDNSIAALESAVAQCKSVREAVLKNRTLLSDTTNMTRASGAELKSRLRRGIAEVEEKPVKNGTSELERELFNKWGTK